MYGYANLTIKVKRLNSLLCLCVTSDRKLLKNSGVKEVGRYTELIFKMNSLYCSLTVAYLYSTAADHTTGNAHRSSTQATMRPATKTTIQ